MSGGTKDGTMRSNRFSKTRAAMALLALALFCRPAVAVGAPKPEGVDPQVAAVEAVLDRFSDALASGDGKTLRALAAPELALLEDGRVYDLDETIASVAQALADGTMMRRIDGLHTRVAGDAAWSRYRVHGVFRSKELEVPLEFLESAVLERRDGAWRLVLLTTLPAAAAAPAPPASERKNP